VGLVRARIVLALLLCVCAPARADDAKVLRVGTSGDYAPFSHAGEGFDVDVARRLAADLGFELRFVPFRWPELRERVARGEIDVAMSGVTWRPERAVTGAMSRAVAAGGPCLLASEPEPAVIGVNRGGFLERWARARYGDARVRAFDDNRSLPARLAAGEVGAIVTDSFELPHFHVEGAEARCEPPRERKVYWLSPARAGELGPRLDAWIAAHEPWLAERRTHWLGGPAPRSEDDHLADLLARRLAMMPFVAAWKRAHQLPIEDLEREAVVLRRAQQGARARGLDPERMRAFFAAQIDLAKAIQRRAPASEARFDLATELRPLLSRLGDRIVAALERGATLEHAGLAPLDALLEPAEIERLRRALSPR